MILSRYRNAILLAAALVQAAGASVIIEQDGNSGGVVPLNFGGPADTGAYAVGWAQTAGYSNVTISATLFEAVSGPVNFWLADSINSPTQHILDSGSVTPNDNIVSIQLLQLALLGPGTYYLILASDATNGGWLYSYPSGASLTEAPGVSYIGGFLASSNNSGFVPTDSFTSRTYPTEFSVIGAPAPEPSTAGLLGLAAALALGYWTSFRKRASVKTAMR